MQTILLGPAALPRVPDSFLHNEYRPQPYFNISLTLKCIQPGIINRDDILPNSDPIYLGNIVHGIAALQSCLQCAAQHAVPAQICRYLVGYAR